MSLLTKKEEETIMTHTISTVSTVKDACNRLMNHMIERYKQDKDSDVMTFLEKLAIKYYGTEVLEKFEVLSQINVVRQYVDEIINKNNKIDDQDEILAQYIDHISKKKETSTKNILSTKVCTESFSSLLRVLLGTGKEYNQEIEKNDDKYDFFYLPTGTTFGSLIANLGKNLETIQILTDDVVPFLDRKNTQIQPTPFTIMQIIFNIKFII